MNLVLHRETATARLAVLGGGLAVSSSLLLVGPVVCLVPAVQRPVREWMRGASFSRGTADRRTVPLAS